MVYKQLVKQGIVVAYCAFFIWACGSGPTVNHRQIPHELPATFGDRVQTDERPLQWKSSFPSKNLQADIDMLLQDNFEIEAALARVEQAAALLGLEKAARYPSVDIVGGFEHSREKPYSGSIAVSDQVKIGAILDWELDIWGRLKAKEKAALLRMEAKRSLADQLFLDLQYLLVQSWIAHHSARKMEKVLLEQRNSNERLLKLTELRLSQGQGAALDVLQQRGRLLASEREVPKTVSTIYSTGNAYAVLVGRYPDYSWLEDDSLPELSPILELPSPRSLVHDRPDLRTAFLDLVAADQEVAAALAEKLPRLSVGLSFFLNGNTLASFGEANLFRFVSSMLAPVFDAGRLSMKVNFREAQVRELLAQFESRLRNAVLEVQNALLREHMLFEEINLLNKETEVAMKTVKRAEEHYFNGIDTYLTVLAAVTKFQRLQQDTIILHHKLVANRALLLTALGARWEKCSEVNR